MDPLSAPKKLSRLNLEFRHEWNIRDPGVETHLAKDRGDLPPVMALVVQHTDA